MTLTLVQIIQAKYQYAEKYMHDMIKAFLTLQLANCHLLRHIRLFQKRLWRLRNIAKSDQLASS